MAICVNEKCDKDPLTSLNCKVVNIDGDLACSKECVNEHKKQMNHFYSVILPDNDKFAEWLGVDKEMLGG